MKITFLVTRADTIGGSHIHVRDMALALQKEGHQVDIIMGGNGPVVDHYRGFGLDPIIIKSLKRNISPVHDFSAYRSIVNILRQINPDIVSTHSSKAGFLGRLAANKLKLSVLFTAHGWSFTTGKHGMKAALFKTLEKWIAPITDKIITVSDFDKKLAVDQLKLSEGKVVTVHNGMGDIEHKYRARFVDHKTVNIVMIARFDKQKDHSELLDAVHEIENIHLQFVGDGPLMDAIRRKAERLGMRDKITFWGRLDRVDEVLSEGQIFTLISNWEGFPRSTIEAMRAGIPTIVSDVGGAGEAVEHGKTGYVVEKGDIQSLKGYVQKLVNNKNKREVMGKAARKRFEKNYTFEIMFKKTNNIYNDLLTSKENVIE